MQLKAIFKIQGWLRGHEARILQKYVIEQQEKSKSDLLEIGSWKGRSSVTIASILTGDRRLWIVDHFQGSLEHQKGQRFYTPPRYTRGNKLWIYPELLENIIKYDIQDKVIVLPLGSEEAAKVIIGQFSFIFIDGDHRYEGVSEDCSLWLSHLEENGILIFHDFQHPPIHKFCNELKQNKSLSVIFEIQTMIAFRHQ